LTIHKEIFSTYPLEEPIIENFKIKSTLGRVGTLQTRGKHLGLPRVILSTETPKNPTVDQ